MNTRPIKTVNPGIVRRTLMKMPLIKKMFAVQQGYLISGPHMPQTIAPLSINAVKLSDLAGTLKKTVMSLDYPELTAMAFTDEVMGWKDAAGMPLMQSWKETLDKARDEHKSGKLELNELVNIESKIISELGNRIKAEFSYDENITDLAQVLSTRKAMCGGYTEMAYATATVLNYTVQAVGVTRFSKPIPPGASHIISFISTADEQMILVDLAPSPIVISKSFDLGSRFENGGNYLMLKSGVTPVDDISDYVRIRFMGINGLIAARYSTGGLYQIKYGKNDQAAMIDYNKAISYDPKSAIAHVNRGILYDLLGQRELALADYNTAIIIDPEDELAHYKRGCQYVDKNQREKALPDLEKAASINPLFVEAIYNCAVTRIYLAIDNRDGDEANKGAEDLLKAGYIDPNLMPKVNALIDGLRSKGVFNYPRKKKDVRPADAINRSDRAQKPLDSSTISNSNIPQEAEAYYKRGVDNNMNGNFQQAIDAFTSAININPQFAKAYSGRGVAYYNLNRFGKAIADYDKAIILKPEYSEAYYYRGTALIASGVTHKNLGQIKKGAADLRAAAQFNSALKPEIEATISELKSNGLLDRRA